MTYRKSFTLFKLIDVSIISNFEGNDFMLKKEANSRVKTYFNTGLETFFFFHKNFKE